MVLLPPVPEKVKRGFTEQEKKIAKRRTIEAYNVPGTGIHPKHLRSLAKDPKVYFYSTSVTRPIPSGTDIGSQLSFTVA